MNKEHQELVEEIALEMASILAPLVESAAHQRLSNYHVRGEWFDCAPDIAREAIIEAHEQAWEGPDNAE